MSVEVLSARELLARAGADRGRLRSRELEAWFEREGLAEIRDGKVVPTPKAVALVDSLRPVYRGDARRRATRIA